MAEPRLTLYCLGMAGAVGALKRAAKQSRSAATREAIFDAGAQLFASKGFSATTVRDVATLAGVNQALVYYYFGNKDALYDEILTEAVEHASAKISEITFEGGVLEPEKRLIEALADAFSSRHYLVPMILREQLDPDHFLNPAAIQRLRGFMALTERVLQVMPLKPEARDYDPQLVHLICVGPIIHFLVAQRIREATADKVTPPLSTPTLHELVQTLSSIVSAGLRQP